MFLDSPINLNENLTVLLGYGGNSVVFSNEADNKVLIVDTKMWGGAKQLKAYVESLGENKEIVIVNTHPHPDHVGGNTRFPGATIITGETDHAIPNKSAEIIFLKQGEEYRIVIGPDTAFVRNIGRAHTSNDVVVYIPEHQLLATGDIVFHHMHPALFKREGSNVASWINTLTTLEEWDIKTVVPGHGKMTDKRAILEAKEYFVSIRDALDAPETLEKLKQRYADYDEVPLSTSFDNTVKFMREE